MKKISRAAALIIALLIVVISVSLIASGYHQLVCHDGESEYVVTHFEVNGSHCRLCQLSTLISSALRHFFETSLVTVFLSIAVLVSMLCGVLIHAFRNGYQTLASLKVRLNN